MPGALALALSVVVAHGFITAAAADDAAAAVGLRLHVRTRTGRHCTAARARGPGDAARAGSDAAAAARQHGAFTLAADPRRVRSRRLVSRAITRRCPTSSRTASAPDVRACALVPLPERQRPARRTPAYPGLPVSVLHADDGRFQERHPQERRRAQGEHQRHDRHRQGDDRRRDQGGGGLLRGDEVDAVDQGGRNGDRAEDAHRRRHVPEARRQPRPSRSATRIIEMPEDTERTEVLRDPRSAFIAYVPAGSIKKGEALVTTGGGKTTRARSATAPISRGSALSPASRAVRRATWCGSCTTRRPARAKACGRI